jgi:hypothetical protein
MPEDETVLKDGDCVLFCGMRKAKNSMQWTLKVMSSLNYVLRYESEPESYLFKQMSRLFKGRENRDTPR